MSEIMHSSDPKWQRRGSIAPRTDLLKERLADALYAERRAHYDPLEISDLVEAVWPLIEAELTDLRQALEAAEGVAQYFADRANELESQE